MLAARTTRPDLSDPALAARWQAMARGAGPFLSWDWVGCEAASRFPDPLLIEAMDGGEPVGMALFNRRRARGGTALFLHEAGDPALDAVFTEHNGVLALPGREEAAWDAILREALRHAPRVVLSGVGPAGLRAAGRAGWTARLQTRLAPFRTLPAAREPAAAALLRRSARAYGDPPRAERAADAVQAAEWLDALLRLHEATWRARGIASGFLGPGVQRFIRALLGRGDTAELLRVSAGPHVLGYLLNLREGGWVCNYQGGFDYAAAPPRAKPGLSAHAAAMERPGTITYDFLAGDSRYKRSLSDAARPLHWFELCRPASLPGFGALVRRLLRRDPPVLAK